MRLSFGQPATSGQLVAQWLLQQVLRSPLQCARSSGMRSAAQSMAGPTHRLHSPVLGEAAIQRLVPRAQDLNLRPDLGEPALQGSRPAPAAKGGEQITGSGHHDGRAAARPQLLIVGLLQHQANRRWAWGACTMSTETESALFATAAGQGILAPISKHRPCS